MQELFHKANGWPPPGEPLVQGKPNKKAQRRLAEALVGKIIDNEK